MGNKYVRGGASIMSGRLSADGTAGLIPEGVHYKIYGADLTAHIDDCVRLHVEYAQRSSGLLSFPGPTLGREEVRGLILEGELLVWKHPRIAMVIRYDEQRRISDQRIPGSSLPTGTFNVNRITWGMNVTLGSTLLIINHERWNAPEPLEDIDLIAVRWVAAF